MADGGLKRELEHNLRRWTEAAVVLSEDLAAHPEISGREYRSSRKIVDLLREGGLEVEHPFREMATAFRAAQKGGAAAKVALLVEYDALPDLGHGCGHSLHGAMSVLAGLALAPLMERLDGELVLFGTPAEECDGAKVPLAADGVFDDVDLALMIHCNGGSSFVAFRALAIDAVEFRFRGRPAHAATAPWEGQNALNGVQLLFHGLDMLRQHLRPEVRLHGIISEGGTAPNVVPEEAAARFYFRAPRRDDLDRVVARAIDCARGAALATGTEMTWHNYQYSFDDVLPNGPAEALMESLFAELGVPLSPPPAAQGSSDVGNLSHRCPILHPLLDITGRPVAAHTHEFARAVTGPRAREALVTGARLLALAALRTFTDGELRRRMRAAFEAARSEGDR